MARTFDLSLLRSLQLQFCHGWEEFLENSGRLSEPIRLRVQAKRFACVLCVVLQDGPNSLLHVRFAVPWLFLRMDMRFASAAVPLPSEALERSA